MKRIGKIINLNYALGIGEISDRNDQEIFFDIADISGVAEPNCTVQFEIEMKLQGLRAIKVIPIDSSN
ncbi:hypothetical protein [Pedobacter rhizosphaerae]|uniref:Cold shock protein, CspA family n=1 Tax=Pedobacter rhizosphaerae TaxID=390241 RepID=A0A1H9VR01_9SPHI|nr:hypothetical protein [Pedobacter rhizosphaerae]SES23787.1 hypothetical protein SAMN04488023_1474 [Pedobacter rhizosphaerae]